MTFDIDLEETSLLECFCPSKENTADNELSNDTLDT